MGKKIIYECGSVFPLEKVKNLTECPICGASFDDFNNGEDTTREDIPSFGEYKITEELKNPDLYFYDIEDEELREV